MCRRFAAPARRVGLTATMSESGTATRATDIRADSRASCCRDGPGVDSGGSGSDTTLSYPPILRGVFVLGEQIGTERGKV